MDSLTLRTKKIEARNGVKKEPIETALSLDNARSFRGVQEKIKDFILQLS